MRVLTPSGAARLWRDAPTSPNAWRSGKIVEGCCAVHKIGWRKVAVGFGELNEMVGWVCGNRNLLSA